ncbi:MAG: peptidoglycan DD-metalloendopeptidase family protein [bacterium]
MPLPSWKDVFTVIFIPHSQSRSHSVSVRWSTLLALICVITLTSFLALILAFVGIMSNPYRVRHQVSSYRQKIDRLEQENRQLNQWQQAVKGLEKELTKTKEQHVALLKLTGFTSLTAAENQSDSTISQIVSAKKLDEIKNILKDSGTRNKQLEEIQEFVQERNQVLDHTPMLWPAEGWVSSPYGYRQHPMGGRGRSHHDGVDLAAWHGSPVRATAAGEISFTGWNGGYGKTVNVKHKFGYETLYGHLSEITVKRGQQVKKGDVIGKIGSTGRSTGSHLHYEVRVNDKPLDPEPYMIENYDVLAQFKQSED